MSFDTVLPVKHSSHGCSHVRPVTISNSVIFVDDAGDTVYEIEPSLTTETGLLDSDLTVVAPHLFEGRTIVDMTATRRPRPTIWYVMSDGDMLGMTYLPEQAVRAWHRHTTDGLFKACVAVREGDEDRLYVIVERVIDGTTKRFVERMAVRRFEEIEEAVVLDGCIKLPDYRDPLPFVGSMTKASPVVVSTVDANGIAYAHGLVNADIVDLTGITYLDSDGEVQRHVANNKFKVAAAGATSFSLTYVEDGVDVDGSDPDTGWAFTPATPMGRVRKCFNAVTALEYAGHTVNIRANGFHHDAKTLDANGYTLLDDWYSRIHVGLGYRKRFWSLPIKDARFGGARVRSAGLEISVEDSVGFRFGTTPYNLKPVHNVLPTWWGQSLKTQTTVWGGRSMFSKWGRDGGVIIQQDDPQPFRVLAMYPKVEVGE